MKLKKLLIVAVFSAIGFTSCKDNQREVSNDPIEADVDRDAELRAEQERLDRENNVTSRIGNNQNLSTFSESMNRNQVTQNWGTNGTTTNGQGQTTTTGEGQTTTAGQGQANTVTDAQASGQGQTMGQGQGQRSYTIFAPSNDAYNSLSETQRNEMMDPQNRDRNVASLNYLMVEERLTEDQLRQQIQNSNGSYTIGTMQGEDITASLDGDNIVLRDGAGNEARITESDTTASDGVVYTIDKVLMPQDPGTNRAASTSMNNNTGTSGAGTNNTGGTNNTNTGTNTQ